MTTLFEQNTQCAVCGTSGANTAVGSSTTFGRPDLDLRPPEMERANISYRVQRCTGCGYCASEIDEAIPGASLIVESSEYVSQLADSAYPELANSFLCKALIEENAEDYAKGTWSCIEAAWACDDEELNDSAKACRIKALNMIKKAVKSDQNLTEEDGDTAFIQVDLLRRSGQLKEAQELIVTKRPTIANNIILQVLAYQEKLITIGDEACHTISEAMGEDE